jgi:UMP-CMP kinase
MDCYPHIKREDKPRVVFILGGPGSGKGTQSQLIQQRYQLHHMSAGDLLREERKNEQSEHGKLLDQYMVEGKIVPCEITVKLLEAEMRRKGYLRGKFLIDGFPRNRENLRRWHLHTHPEVHVPFIIVLECGETCMM